MILPPTEENIALCADALRRGELIGFPTETVYGIAADATNPDAIRKIYELKQRPTENPLIVHIASASDLSKVAIATPQAEKIGVAFWPGPLTLVLPKVAGISSRATGGLETVAVRVPAHPVANALLKCLDGPVVAPSANKFTELSPTRPEDLSCLITKGLFAVLDGGPSEVGVESTVLDMTTEPPTLLRPGGVPRSILERLLGPLLKPEGEERRSPGMYIRHYAPKSRLRLVEKIDPEAAGLTFERTKDPRKIQMPLDPKTYARALYAALHTLDRTNPEEIQVEIPPITGEWEAVWDRLTRASEKVAEKV